MPVASEFPVIKTNFNRGGNLTGQDSTMGVANVMLSMVKNGKVFKLDSDTVIKNNSFFEIGDIAGFTHPNAPAGALGCCYSISERALLYAIECLKKLRENGVRTQAEDILITSYANTYRVPDFESRIYSNKLLGVWHPDLAPNIYLSVANFGNHRINGEWAHPSAIEAMRRYANG